MTTLHDALRERKAITEAATKTAFVRGKCYNHGATIESVGGADNTPTRDHTRWRCTVPESYPIPGFPRYSITHDGRVFSETNWRGLGKRELSQHLDDDGYPRVRVVNPQGRRKTKTVHTLMAITFLGPKPRPDCQTRHLDGNPQNNRLSNLAWGTPKENCDDRARHGRTATGDRNGSRIHSKLTAEQVTEIRQLYATGEFSCRKLGAMFGVHNNTISRIIRGDLWSWKT